MAESFSPEQIAEFKECFSLYDRDGDGLITMEQMKLVMRSLNQCPTQSELNEMTRKNVKNRVNFPQFLKLMWDHMQQKRNMQEDISEAFKAYDSGNKGYITMKDLRHICMKTGEKLSQQEFDYMLYQAGISKSTTRINYSDLARVFSKV